MYKQDINTNFSELTNKSIENMKNYIKTSR